MASVIDPQTTMGVVTLSVADMNRSLAYYLHGIGLSVLGAEGNATTLGVGSRALLRLVEQPGARLQRRATGLYHFALRVPSRPELARVLQHLIDSDTAIGGASEHLVSEALYLSDPDGHGIEIYRDRPRDAWYDAQGQFRMATERLDLAGLLRELPSDPWHGLHTDTDMGHVHLQVADVAAAERFYIGVLGFERMATYPGAAFVSAGGYHHHLGLNSWAGVGVPAPPPTAARLLSYEICLPTRQALQPVLDRITAARLPLNERPDGWLVRDPSHNDVLLRVA